MKKRIIHNVCICLALLLLASCKEQTDTPLQEDGMVTLSISAAMVSRAVDTGDDNRIYSELMHTLRIIIFDEDGNIEHNRLYTFDEGLFKSENHNFLVKANQTKNIYLLANCESFKSQIEGNNITKEALDVLELKSDEGWFTPNQQNKDFLLPATAKYEITVGETSQTETLYVVHAANKISFEFDNQSGEDITISEWRLSSIAQNSYLIPHITGEDENTPEEDRWYNKVLAQYTQNHTEEGLSKDYAGVMNYTVPADANHNVFTQTCEEIKIADKNKATLYSVNEPFYLHESKSMDNDPTTEEKQEYTLSCVINSKVYDAVLTNLPSLFRGTYIKVTATITGLYEEGEVDNPFGIIIDWELGETVDGVLTPAD